MKKLLLVAILTTQLTGMLTADQTTEVSVAEIEALADVNTNQWAITKEQMAQIMQRPTSEITNEQMDDFTRMVDTFNLDQINIAYLLGQAGHESNGLVHAVEINPGHKYEWRRDIGNIHPGDGVRYAGGGYIQISGRTNYTGFYRYMKSKGIDDYKIVSVGKHHVAKHYPWSSAGWWWMKNNMIQYCKKRPSIDAVGAKVNGRYLPNGAYDRRAYTNRAFNILGV